MGEDVGFEIATKGVTVEYGTVDKLGNVTWSNEAPVIKDCKAAAEGFYNDTYYHFLVKVTKGSKTVYAHMQFDLEQALLDYGFSKSAYTFGKNEEVNSNDLLTANVTEFNYAGLMATPNPSTSSVLSALTSLAVKKDVYAADKAAVQKVLDNYIKVTGVDTSVLGETTINTDIDFTGLTKAAKEDAELAAVMVNYNLAATTATGLVDALKAISVEYYYDTPSDNDPYVTIYGAGIADFVSKYLLPKTAKVTVSDIANQIRISNKIKTFHVKKAAKLKSTKKFQLKAKANYGKVNFKKVTAKYAKIKISKTGKVTVKKGLKKGTYKVKFNAFAPNKTVKRALVIKIKK